MIEQGASPYPVRFTVEYPDRPLDRLSTGLRIFYVIPILIILSQLTGASYQFSQSEEVRNSVVTAGGFLFFATLLMILFRQKYPRWWFDWNRELLRFTNRVGAYALLLRDEYPSTDERQAVHLDFPYPDARQDLNRWLPLVKWFLAIPHYIVLFFLGIATFFVVIVAWFAILFTGRYPRGLFDFVVGVMRWSNRVQAYAVILVTDDYPPFRLGE
jgi:hypothetical protein